MSPVPITIGVFTGRWLGVLALEIQGHLLDLQQENEQIVFIPKKYDIFIAAVKSKHLISTFKVLYIKQTFRYIFEEMKNDDSLPYDGFLEKIYNLKLY
ncbi:hypothetical protein TNCV_1826681 [Trichonephila clavipes]|nr:hypothetical protein TNCV_1826681 [Trichonephila clavipes]